MQKYTVEINDFFETIRWYKEGTDILHREDGPAVENLDGDKFWFKDGKLHRDNGPAVEFIDGTKYWCKEGKYHREDGPAIDLIDGRKEYWLNGKEYSEAAFLKLTSKAPIDPCNGKEVIIEGKKYKLTLIDK